MTGPVKVRPLVWDATYFVCHASGSLEFFLSEQDASNHAEWLGRGYYTYSHENLGRFGDRLRQEKEAWEKEVRRQHEARILAAIQPDPDARQADLAKAFCMGRDAAADRYSAGGGLQGDYPMWDFFGDAEKAIRALTPPADLAAKIGGE